MPLRRAAAFYEPPGSAMRPVPPVRSLADPYRAWRRLADPDGATP